jgi:hypothetical protein
MKLNYIFPVILCLFIYSSAPVFSSAPAPGDTIHAPKILVPPVIDGSASDACWDSAAWNPMPYVWIPYGAKMSASDFTGRFKIVWSDEENLLYMVFEITDDIFVNGYDFSPANGNYYQYDVVELFVDEDRSGGNHLNDNNAFAYHITGGSNYTDYDVCDMWTSGIVNYKDHFPGFKRVQNGNVFTWEFSMMVIPDNFTPDDVPDLFKAELTTGKKIGFSAAYCDDDHSSSNPQRDNFIASKYETQANSNNSYIDATIFGLLELVDKPTSGVNSSVQTPLKNNGGLSVYPNPVSDFALLSISDSYRGMTEISIYDATGKRISHTEILKNQEIFTRKMDMTGLKNGLYIIKFTEDSGNKIIKVIR